MGNWTQGLVGLVTALWEAGITGKLLTAAAGWLAVTAPDPNFYLNLFTIMLVILVAFPIAKDRRKGVTIKELTDELAAKDLRNKGLSEDLHAARQQTRNLEQACQHCKTEAARWQAKYEEAQRYSAQPAVEHFEQLLAEQQRVLAEQREEFVKHRDAVAERHALMLELAEKTLQMTGRQAEVLDGVTEALERLNGHT